MLGCRDCLGKLLRQLRAREARGRRQEAGGARVGALGSEANTREAAAACEPRTPAHTFTEFLATPPNASLNSPLSKKTKLYSERHLQLRQ